MTTLAETRLAEMTREIREYEEQARQSASLALQYKVAIGKRLTEVRKLLERDDYRRWARDEFGWDERHVRRHLQLYRARTRVSVLPPGASLRMALAALREPKALLPAEDNGELVYVLTGHVPWGSGKEEPDTQTLIAACADWKVRHG